MPDSQVVTDVRWVARVRGLPAIQNKMNTSPSTSDTLLLYIFFYTSLTLLLLPLSSKVSPSPRLSPYYSIAFCFVYNRLLLHVYAAYIHSVQIYIYIHISSTR